MRELGFILCGLAAAAGSVLVALSYGSVPLTFAQIAQGLFSGGSGLEHDIIRQLRLPRALAAFACGGLLAFAGALLQALLRNALADSYVLGVSGGASLGALSALVLGTSAMVMNAAAFTGALAALLIVFGATFRGGSWNLYRLLLSGVVLSAGFSALTSLILVTAPQAQVKGMLFWLMGDLSYAESPLLALVILLVLTLAGIAQSVRLDLLGLGDLKARSLGAGVAVMQTAVFFSAALATVAAVMLGGAIGFVGLMMPHAVRLLGATQHRLLIPLSVLFGGSFLTLADTCARTLAAPQQLPVGIFTALIGVPVMLWLLGRRP